MENTLFFKAVEQNIPPRFLPRQCSNPWINPELKKSIRKKRRLWKQAKMSDNPDKWLKYKKLNNKVKDEVNKAYWSYVNNLVSSLPEKPRKFWSFVKARTGISNIASCISHCGFSAYTPKSKGDLLNSYFNSIFNQPFKEMDNLNGDLIPVTGHTIDDVVVSADDVFKVLSTLDTKRACSQISPRILKECAHELSNSLAALFN